MDQLSKLEKLILALPSVKARHAPTEPLYALLKEVAIDEVQRIFPRTDDRAPRRLRPFGEIVFPYWKMGAIDSLDLFGLDELIIFSFYWANRNRYRRVLDIGANLGLHSVVLGKCGFEVECYEPDPVHFGILKRNLALNGGTRVQAVNAAVSSRRGTADFIRVLGNTTGSHLAGAKANPYGDLETFSVELVEFNPLLARFDLVKMDVEGHEKEILLSTSRESWQQTDCLVEIGTAENARSVYDYFRDQDVPMYAQKLNWERVTELEDMPTSYRDGTLFISHKSEMPWGSG